MILACLLGCAATDPRAAYLHGLRTGECAPVTDTQLRDDCWIARVGREGVDWCGETTAGRARGECYFQLAERTGDPSLCPRATPFADDCALHLLSRGFGELLPASPGEKESEVAARIAAAGLGPEDPRPWSAWYRWVLGGQRPLDRASCAQVAEPLRREACERTGVALYHDLLNRARDLRTYPCDGGPLPPELQHTPDPELDAARAARADLCP